MVGGGFTFGFTSGFICGFTCPLLRLISHKISPIIKITKPIGMAITHFDQF